MIPIAQIIKAGFDANQKIIARWWFRRRLFTRIPAIEKIDPINASVRPMSSSVFGEIIPASGTSTGTTEPGIQRDVHGYLQGSIGYHRFGYVGVRCPFCCLE